MAYKCPKCKYTRKGKNAYKEVQAHYYREHHKSKAKPLNKGQDKKVHVFKPVKNK